MIVFNVQQRASTVENSCPLHRHETAAEEKEGMFGVERMRCRTLTAMGPNGNGYSYSFTICRPTHQSNNNVRGTLLGFNGWV